MSAASRVSGAQIRADAARHSALRRATQAGVGAERDGAGRGRVSAGAAGEKGQAGGAWLFNNQLSRYCERSEAIHLRAIVWLPERTSAPNRGLYVSYCRFRYGLNGRKMVRRGGEIVYGWNASSQAILIRRLVRTVLSANGRM